MKFHPGAIVTIAALALLVGFSSGLLVGDERGIPLVGEEDVWAIAVYQGDSPFDLRPPGDADRPALTAAQVSDVRAGFVADPFLLRFAERWFLFFEVFNRTSGHGDLAYASSPDGLNWIYEQVILDEDFHLSYPQVFAWEGEFYMVPESGETLSVRLYRAEEFPRRWVFMQTLLEGEAFVDPSLFYYSGRWWMFVETNPYAEDTLRLYSAVRLTGPWQEHPNSPVVLHNPDIARPGGRVLQVNGRLYRFAQDDHPVYGNQVWAFEIVELTPETYREVLAIERPVLSASGRGWNALGMHQIDAQPLPDGRWLAAVDGKHKQRVFGLDY
jgi:hypothetical protein